MDLLDDNDCDESSVLDVEWKRKQDAARKDGFRDGFDAGQERTLQKGFDNGFRRGAELADYLGQVRGVLSALIGHNLQNKDSPISHQLAESLKDILNEFEDIQQKVVSAGREAVVKSVADNCHGDMLQQSCIQKAEDSVVVKNAGDCCTGRENEGDSARQCCREEPTTTGKSDMESATGNCCMGKQDEIDTTQQSEQCVSSHLSSDKTDSEKDYSVQPSNKTEIHIDTCNSPTETEKYSATNKTERESPLLSSDEAKTDKDNSLTKTENSSSLPLSNNTEKDGSSIDKYISTTTTDSEIPRICLPSCPSSDALINLIDRLKSLLAENQVDHCVNLSHQLVLE